MLPLRFARQWQIASAALLVAVLIAAIVPAIWLWPDKERAFSWFGGIDKWAHAATFTVLAVWFAGQYRQRAYWRVGIGLLGFGLTIEICQRMLSYRSAEWLDVAADVVGIIVGLGVAAIGFGGWCSRFEQWYLNKRV